MMLNKALTILALGALGALVSTAHGQQMTSTTLWTETEWQPADDSGDGQSIWVDDEMKSYPASGPLGCVLKST